MKKLQIHNRLQNEQASLILKAYYEKEISSAVARDKLGIGKSRFFELLKKYREFPTIFNLQNIKIRPSKQIDSDLEPIILDELKKEKLLIQNKDIPIKSYNYSAVRDNLIKKSGKSVSLPTIIDRAKQNGFCLRVKRLIDSYRKISLFNVSIEVPRAIPKTWVEIRLIPDLKSQLVTLRFWQENTFLGIQKVHFSLFKGVQF